MSLRARIVLFLVALVVVSLVDPPHPVIFGVAAYLVLMFPKVPRREDGEQTRSNRRTTT